MIKFTEGNLLESSAEALVNTVNTVGVMGKGVALMFKEAFPENFKAYEAACKEKRVHVGKMFVTERHDFYGPKWIINFPTKQHWRFPSKLEWVADGLDDLHQAIRNLNIASIALPPLGAGNGGLNWHTVRDLISTKLHDLENVEVIVYEPTRTYQNVAKRTGVETLTPSRALIAELVRRYSILGIDCSLLEIQKLGYFAERFSIIQKLPAMKFEFQANKYGPYSTNLKHLLNSLDGSYLSSEKRLGDAGPFDPIQFNTSKADLVSAFFTTQDAKPFKPTLEATTQLIDGFESPLGMELLATVDWLIHHDHVRPEINSIKSSLSNWAGDTVAAARKMKLFEDRYLAIALDTLKENHLIH